MSWIVLPHRLPLLILSTNVSKFTRRKKKTLYKVKVIFYTQVLRQRCGHISIISEWIYRQKRSIVNCVVTWSRYDAELSNQAASCCSMQQIRLTNLKVWKYFTIMCHYQLCGFLLKLHVFFSVKNLLNNDKCDCTLTQFCFSSHFILF